MNNSNIAKSTRRVVVERSHAESALEKPLIHLSSSSARAETLYIEMPMRSTEQAYFKIVLRDDVPNQCSARAEVTLFKFHSHASNQMKYATGFSG
jgi:hypothetical protein